jgi:hypothetical protein
MALLVPSFRHQSGGQSWTVGTRPADTMGTALTASGSSHTLGSKTQLVAATSYEAEWCRVTFINSFVSATLTDQLCNIYIGAGGSEVPLIPNLQSGWAATVTTGVPTAYWFPLRIPRGSRISADLQALIASDTVECLFEYGVSNGEHWVGSGIEALGATTASSRGTSVTPGSGSEGSFATMGTSTRRYRYLNVGIQGNNDTSYTAGSTSWDIGSGSSVLQSMEEFMSIGLAAESLSQWTPRGFSCDVPSGTSLQLRGQHSATSSGLQYGILYGVY